MRKKGGLHHTGEGKESARSWRPVSLLIVHSNSIYPVPIFAMLFVYV